MSAKPLLHRHYEGEDYKDQCIKCLLANMNWGMDGCTFKDPATWGLDRNRRMIGVGVAQEGVRCNRDVLRGQQILVLKEVVE